MSRLASNMFKTFLTRSGKASKGLASGLLGTMNPSPDKALGKIAGWGGAALIGEAVAGDAISGHFDYLRGKEGPRLVRAAQEAGRQRLQERLRLLEQQQLHESMARNAARLAAANPHLYNEIMAGRRLPDGAIVLGGIPRTDLLEELAYDMSSGAYPKQQNPDEQIQQLLSSLGGQ